MRRIVVFCEDIGHEKVITGLLRKIVPNKLSTIETLSSRHGKGRALSELERYLVQIKNRHLSMPDAIVAAIDANCEGYNVKKNEIDGKVPKELSDIMPVIHAVPDPHVERWMLLDAYAFKIVFGKGCSAPKQKCEKDYYKKILNKAITDAGGYITLGWIEHAEEIIKNLDIEMICQQDDSVKRFIEEVRVLLKKWGDLA